MAAAGLPASIVGRFRAVAFERLERLEAAWAALTQGSAGTDISIQVQRELHTLKGDAHVLGFTEIAQVCHKLEELFAVAHTGGYAVPDEFDLVVTMAFRFLATLVRKQAGTPLGGLDLVEFIRQMDGVLADAHAWPTNPSESRLASRPEGLAIEALDRVSPETQRRLAVTATNIFIESLAASGSAKSRLYSAWLELRQLLATFSTVSLRSMLARYAPAALELARKLGKQVEVVFELVDVPVRLEVAEALDIAALHALRNAMDHGIEPPDERRALGKPPAGTIVIRAGVVNDMLEVAIEDDGRGIDWDVVRRRGIEMGFLTPQTAQSASEQELVELLFLPGFSTRNQADAISGRGIGLDTVRAALARAGAGGGISLLWRTGAGTKALMRVPQPRRFIDIDYFRAPDLDLLLAVPAGTCLAAAAGVNPRAAHPLEALGVSIPAVLQGTVEPWAIKLSPDTAELWLRTGSAPSLGTAERVCPTSDEDPAEVIRIGGREGLLLRPEHLGSIARPT